MEKNLKHSKVKLISYTKWADDENKPEDIISYCARVSNPKNQENFDTSEKLLKYCIKHGHWSVFEMANVVMEINTTRDIARQILRHRSFSFQEFSQRYADPTIDLGYELREMRFQDKKNRQNSVVPDPTDTNLHLEKHWKGMQKELYENAQKVYNWALNNDIAKEVARAVLPEGLQSSRMYMNGTVRSWHHFCQLRMGNGTQKETQEIATECWDILIELYPFLKD
jgi:thymidylate synthase (FAD)